MDAKQTRIAIEKAIDWMTRHVRISEPTTDDCVGTALCWVLIDRYCQQTENEDLIFKVAKEDIEDGLLPPSPEKTLESLSYGLAYGFTPLNDAMQQLRAKARQKHATTVDIPAESATK